LADIKAFAKAVAPRKTIIFALQKSIKHLSLLIAFRQTMFQIKPLLSAKTLEYDFDVPVLTKNILSISFSGSRDGGAHPFYSPFMDNKTFDLLTGKAISFVDIIPSNKTVALNTIINDIAAHNDDMLKDLRPLTVKRDASFYLSKEGLVILLFQDVNFKQWVSATGFPFDICVPYDKLKSINPTFVEQYKLEK
jgi:hypothetical protein